MSDVLLTLENVKEWRKEKQVLLARLRVLDRRLEAASVFVDESGEDDQSPEDETEKESLSLVDAIVLVLREAGGVALSNKEIKKRLPSVGFDPSQMSVNYYYTATKRLTDRGAVQKHGDGSYSLPENEAPAGASEANAEEARTLSGVQNPNPSPFG